LTPLNHDIKVLFLTLLNHDSAVLLTPLSQLFKLQKALSR
jgi:hypothetical protein